MKQIINHLKRVKERLTTKASRKERKKEKKWKNEIGTKNYFIQEWSYDLFTYHHSHWFTFLSLWSLEQFSQCAECCMRNEPFILLLPRAWYPWEEWQNQEQSKTESNSRYRFGIIKASSERNILRDILQFKVHKAGKCNLLEFFTFQNMFYNLFTQLFKYVLCKCLKM